MKNLSILVLIGWLTLIGGVRAQEVPTPGSSSDDRGEIDPQLVPEPPSDGRAGICEELRTDMTPEDLVALAEDAGLELTGEATPAGEIFLEWSDPDTEEFLRVSFVEGVLAEISCSVRIQLPAPRTREPRESTCEEFELGMSLEDLEEKISDDRLEATNRRVSAGEFLWEWENPRTSESIQIIISNGEVVNVFCTQLPQPFEFEELDGEVQN
ncbi:hypothetical protein IQ235_17250 [Oscillatoriales cyanobacterium LEGE 11467]|uniref:Uncharacterized protein n=1 Tax=Zarconia navalis LEGE 11467 TaxID=1828826 RepID=A0A928ZA68_9CYAN|nr:hypothetical protein [Zarconia navalis]MBE9042519.1 hypothetical protein [Zarconia navalis LEGE 11467]